MQSFTFMSDEAVKATVDAFTASGDLHYPIELNASDFTYLMWALQFVHDNAHGIVAVPGAPEDVSDWAGTFGGGIAETLNVDWV
jgi:hypothetical protein